MSQLHLPFDQDLGTLIPEATVYSYGPLGKHTVTDKGFVILPENADVPEERVMVPMTAEEIEAVLDVVEDHHLYDRFQMAYQQLTGEEYLSDFGDDEIEFDDPQYAWYDDEDEET